MKLVSPLSFYRVWCKLLGWFLSSQFGLAKLIAAIEKYGIQGLLKLVLLGSFFWGSLSRRAQQIIVPEFANHLAGERAAMWHALGGTRTLWHHDLTRFSAIQRKIVFAWAWPAFQAQGVRGHLCLLWICGSLSDCQQVLTAAHLKKYPASAQNVTPSLQHTTNRPALWPVGHPRRFGNDLSIVWVSFWVSFCAGSSFATHTRVRLNE